jgi:uncharacterized protein YkwD
MSVRRLLLLVLLVGSLLALPLPASAGPRTTAEFNRVTNAARRAHGLRPMTVSPTPDQAGPGPLGSDGPPGRGTLRRPLRPPCPWHNDISRKAGRWVWLGQNVGCGTLGRDGVKASVRRIQNAFMSSPGHRRNILYPRATSFGASTWIAGPIIWVTVNFKQSPG